MQDISRLTGITLGSMPLPAAGTEDALSEEDIGSDTMPEEDEIKKEKARALAAMPAIPARHVLSTAKGGGKGEGTGNFFEPEAAKKVRLRVNPWSRVRI